MSYTLQELTPEQAEHFIAHKFIRIEGALPRAFTEEKVQRGWQRLGVREDDPDAWPFKRTNMPSYERFLFREHAPRAWRAICDLTGGESRIKPPCEFGDNFILIRPHESDVWTPPSSKAGGWHKDGDWFLHFLDSPEQGMLGILLWRDILPKGGGTFFAPDSVEHVARFLVDHPEGVRPEQFNFQALIDKCSDFREITGKAGDLFLLHPFTLHAASTNTRPEPRLICNPNASLVEPMCFDRPDPADFSLIERATLRALGVDRLPFVPTRPRERIIPERERRWLKEQEEERRRLETAAAQAST
jgi:hypothetical protein